jgi:hypothetical protein
VAFATRSGDAAWEPEGDDARNSYFTAALLSCLQDSGTGKGVRQLMPIVRDLLESASRRCQIVEARDQLVGDDVQLVPSVIGDTRLAVMTEARP